MQISQYSRDEAIKGKVYLKEKRLAAEFFNNDLYSVIPRSWTSAHSRDMDTNDTQWIFLTSERSKPVGGATSLRDVIFSANNVEPKKLVEGDYSSLDEARALKKRYSVVTYRDVPSCEIAPPLGIWCSCSPWSRNNICGHAVCVSYIMGGDTSEEAKEHWKYIRTYLARPGQRRNKGRIGSQRLPDDERFGVSKTTRTTLQKKRRRPSE